MERADTLQHLPEYLPGHCHLGQLEHQRSPALEYFVEAKRSQEFTLLAKRIAT